MGKIPNCSANYKIGEGEEPDVNKGYEPEARGPKDVIKIYKQLCNTVDL